MPPLECAICGQGVHEERWLNLLSVVSSASEYISNKNNVIRKCVNPFKLPGIFYICAACEERTIPKEEQAKKKGAPNKTTPADSEDMSSSALTNTQAVTPPSQPEAFTKDASMNQQKENSNVSRKNSSDVTTGNQAEEETGTTVDGKSEVGKNDMQHRYQAEEEADTILVKKTDKEATGDTHEILTPAISNPAATATEPVTTNAVSPQETTC